MAYDARYFIAINSSGTNDNLKLSVFYQDIPIIYDEDNPPDGSGGGGGGGGSSSDDEESNADEVIETFTQISLIVGGCIVVGILIFLRKRKLED